jgi:hypothetical protein
MQLNALYWCDERYKAEELLNNWRNDEYTVSQAHQHFQARYRIGRGQWAKEAAYCAGDMCTRPWNDEASDQLSLHIQFCNGRDPSGQPKRRGVDVLSNFEGWGGQTLLSALGKARFAWKAQ